jgi:pimeloyl-ACP methyl ester carboxylesterase
MAARAGAQTVEAAGASHSIALSQPKAVADLIRTAVAAVSAAAVTA